MKTTLEPMFGLLNISGGEIIMILASLLIFFAVIACIAAVVVLLTRTSRSRSASIQSSAPAPASRLATKTEVLPRKCPQCGAELKPDAPEGLCPACLLQRGIATEGGAPPGTPPFMPPEIQELAKLFPQLEILELIGKGGMGAVYKARQPALDRFIALKILAPRSTTGDLDFASRFNREARALAKLNHPNIVAVYDFGEVSGLNYFLMEFVDGPNLRQVEQAGKLSSREALEIIPQICSALQFAHDEGIVHRDIKPENVLLDKKGRVKIADFGLAKILGKEAQDFRLTGAKDVVGTPHYMAPEQVEKPQEVDHRADIYSLGVVFYEMLTGELPLGKFQPPSQKVQVDVRLDEVVLRSLAKEPERRYQQVSEVKSRVENISATSATAQLGQPGVAPLQSGESLSAEDATRLSGEILSRDYVLQIGSCVSRGWNLVMGDFWIVVGISLLIGMLRHAANSTLIGLVVGGPLSAGLSLYFLKKTRNEHSDLGTVFSGFSVAFVPLMICGLLITLLVFLGLICLVLPGIYLMVAWAFALPLAIDKRLDASAAMKLSREVISRHWWKFLWFFIVLVFLNLLGVLFCGIGVLVTIPVTHAALMFAYQDIVGSAPSPRATAPASSTSRDSSWRIFAIVGVCLVAFLIAVATIGALMAIAIPNFVRARARAEAVQRESQAVEEQHRQDAFARRGKIRQGGLPGSTKIQQLASEEKWSPALASGEKFDFQHLLDEAKTLSSEGNYEEALQRYIWYFNHSKSDAAQAGVRISFALSDWIELGRRYPKARQALVEIRDLDAREFSEGRGYLQLFMEISSINEQLGEPDATVTLFKQIGARDQKLAEECYGLVEPKLIQDGEYQLCLSYIGDPMQKYEQILRSRERMRSMSERQKSQWSDQMQRLREMAKTNSNSPFLPRDFPLAADMSKMADDGFVSQVRQLVEVLVATDRTSEAERICERALTVLDDSRLRSAVSDAKDKVLSRPPRL